jgi:ABC-type Fe3+/spermidine/putrescine transport system ATPase subunit
MQRLALCRALVYEPDLLLLDEPFSNLDAKLREQMRVEVKLLQRRLGITVLFVTHDQVEALSLSDRIAVMRGGQIEQVGSPRTLYQQPASAFVRDFLGQTVILRGRVVTVGSGGLDSGVRGVTVEMNGALAGRVLAGRAAPSASLPPGAAAHVAIRPEDIQVSPDDPGRSQEANHLPAVVDALSFVGDRYEAQVTLGGELRIVLFLSRARDWREGERLQLGFPPEMVSVWPA